MTTITLPRATVEQALEALEAIYGDSCDAIHALRAALAQQAEPVADLFNCPKCGRHDYGMHGACPTCDAQQAEPVDTDCHTQGICQRSGYGIGKQAEPVEPVAWLYTGIKQDGTEHGPHLVWKPEYMDAMSASKGAKATPLYFAPPRQAEPVEPVAWVHIDAHNSKVRFLEWTQQAKGYRGDWIKTPLCNCAQPHRKPLTDEKISDLWCEVSNTDFVTADTHVFARAIERAHGIGRQTDPQIEDRLARHGIPKP